MDLRDYLRAVRKNWWMPVAAVALAVAVAFLVTVRTPPQYATAVTFFVTTPNAGASEAYQGGLFSTQRVKSYADLLSSDRLATAIVAETDVPLTPAQVRQRITAEAVPDTVLLQATVTDGSAARSQQIARSLGTQFALLVGELETPPGAAAPTVKVAVVAGPTLAPDPVAPRPFRNLGLGILLGLLVGIGLAVLREVLDTTVRTVEVLRRVAAAPTLGTIPFDGSSKGAPLIVERSGRSPRAEAFRQLRTNLQFVDVDHAPRSFVVTSAVAGEGKSTTAANLAIVFAEAGSSVVLVEADLRRPRVARYLGLEGAVGLTNVLAGQAALDDVLQRWGGTGLWVLPSGFLPPNPSELLGSQNMADLLGGLESAFDTVIVDSPPLLPVTDAAVTATRVDGALLVARYGHTTRTQLATAAEALTAVDARLLGSVFNMMPVRGPDAYAYAYGYTSDPPATTDLAPATRRDGAAVVPPVGADAAAEAVPQGRRAWRRSQVDDPTKTLVRPQR